MGFTLYLDSLGSKLAPVAFLLSFSLFSAALVWFRRKTGTWTMAADVTARIAHCSWRQLHPRLAKYLCILQRSFLWFPAARYGFTPIWFNHSIPSSGVFLTSDPQHPDGWNRPESELATGHATHLAVRRFQLGMITASCYEYRHSYNNPVRSPASIFTPPVLWESLCSTQPNGVDYNLRAAFFGHREDLPAFYDLVSSAIPAN
jgi:hypothetical protein